MLIVNPVEHLEQEEEKWNEEGKITGGGAVCFW